MIFMLLIMEGVNPSIEGHIILAESYKVEMSSTHLRGNFLISLPPGIFNK